jgi:hypothetical protein
MFERKLIVSGVTVSLKPYSEARMKQLVDVNREIQEFIEKNPDLSVTQIADQRASWYKRKAAILWETPHALDDEFFKSEDFEASLLKDSEDFFLTNSVYL